MKRVLVIDDSPTARAVLRLIIESSPELELAGEANDGSQAVEQVRRLKPDVVAMDLHMPHLDGLAATRAIMASDPIPVVIVTASATADDVSLALDAMRAGALAVVRKPSGPLSIGFAAEARHLAGTLRDMADVRVVRRRSFEITPTSPTPPAAATSGRAIAIAASTGGPAALVELLSNLPSNLTAPILVVQHIAPGFTEGLVDWLAHAITLSVCLASSGERPQPGVVYIAPEDRHLTVSSGVLLLTREPAENGFRPSGDVLLRSVGREYGSSALGVVLTGMGRDGTEGARAIRAAGGRVYAQDQASSVVYGMPASVIEAGLADAALPPRGIASHLAALCRPA